MGLGHPASQTFHGMFVHQCFKRIVPFFPSHVYTKVDGKKKTASAAETTSSSE